MLASYLATYKLHASTAMFRRHRAQAITILRAFLARCSAPYVAFSGGKDSSALLVLLAECGATEVPVFTQADDLDWPEKRGFCHAMVERLGFYDYTYAESGVSARDQFAALDFASTATIRGTFSHVIADYVATRARTGVLLGLRAEESRARRRTRRVQGTLHTSRQGFTRGLPIADWCGVDVFALLVSTGMPWMPLYDCDSFAPPHTLRMSWLLNPTFVDRGAAQWLRHYFPRRWRELCDLNPRLRSVT